MDIYQSNGYANRNAYLNGVADDMGIEPTVVFALADMLGENEDFDGLITMLVVF